MHELSIAEALLDQANDILKKEGYKKIVKITVVIGKLSGVEPYALEAAFPIAAEIANQQEACLEIETVPLKILCNECKKISICDDPYPICINCGSNDTNIISGKELLIKSLEMRE